MATEPGLGLRIPAEIDPNLIPTKLLAIDIDLVAPEEEASFGSLHEVLLAAGASFAGQFYACVGVV